MSLEYEDMAMWSLVEEFWKILGKELLVKLAFRVVCEFEARGMSPLERRQPPMAQRWPAVVCRQTSHLRHLIRHLMTI